MYGEDQECRVEAQCGQWFDQFLTAHGNLRNGAGVGKVAKQWRCTRRLGEGFLPQVELDNVVMKLKCLRRLRVGPAQGGVDRLNIVHCSTFHDRAITLECCGAEDGFSHRVSEALFVAHRLLGSLSIQDHGHRYTSLRCAARSTRTSLISSLIE